VQNEKLRIAQATSIEKGYRRLLPPKKRDFDRDAFSHKNAKREKKVILVVLSTRSMFTKFAIATLIGSTAFGVGNAASHSNLRSRRENPSSTPVKTLSAVAKMFPNKTTTVYRPGDMNEIDQEHRSLFLFSCNDDDFTLSSLTGLDSPLFTIGDVSLQYLLQQQLDRVVADLASSIGGVLPPQMICAGSGSDVSSVGRAYGVAACESIDFLPDADVYAFGFQAPSPTAQSFCTAMNPATGTYAISQENILKPLRISKTLNVTFDLIGISTSKQLKVNTLNKMWDGGTPDYLLVPGHVVVRGTGVMFVELSSKVAATISIQTTVLVDADYNNDGLGRVIADDSDVRDFALLVSGRATPVLEITSVDKAGITETDELDLSKLIMGDVDVYTVRSDADGFALQIAGSVKLKLQGICDVLPGPGEILCDIFDGESGLTGEVQTYGNKDGFGLRFAVEGKFGLASEFVEDMIGWPEGGAEFSAMFSMRFRGDGLMVCADANALEWCWNKCNSHSQCDEDEFCHGLGMCIKDRKLGGWCGDDEACESGYCVGGFCSECPYRDKSEGCESDEFCAQHFNFGYRCEKKRGLSGPCLDDNVCQSGYCVGLPPASVCGECPVLDSSEGCESDEFCAGPMFRCEKKRGLAGPCLNDNVCQSGLCVGLPPASFCSECPVLDSSEGCANDEFCAQDLLSVGLRCEKKRGVGGMCLSNNVCQSGYCVGLPPTSFCSECPKIDSEQGCPSGDFCTQTLSNVGLKCVDKRSRGGTCSSDTACKSGKCDVTFCVDCYRSGSGCTSSEYCDLGQCKPKLARGKVCVENRVCQSGKCDATRCVDCYRNGSGCKSSQYCDLGRCKTKLDNNKACVENRVCKSGKCGVTWRRPYPHCKA
jgi:hypothetical protein